MTTASPPRWALDPCPPEPLVLLDELALPPGASPAGTAVVPGVASTRAVVPAGDRAVAAALCCPAASGVLVRATAAWVWTGDVALTPTHLDLGTFPGAPALPGPRPDGRRHALAVRRSRWDTGTGWTRVGGVPVTDPVSTALGCTRLGDEQTASRCVTAMVVAGVVDPDELARRLADEPARPGRARVTRMLAGCRHDGRG